MLAQTLPSIDSLSSLGAAGLIGAMWLWERRQSIQREQQLDEAHERVMSDRMQTDAFVELVQHNTEAISRLVQQQGAMLEFFNRCEARANSDQKEDEQKP